MKKIDQKTLEKFAKEKNIDKNKVPEYPAILLGYGGLTEKEIEQGFRELDKIMLFF